ncbi:hypothetical protein Anas_03305 [Armadillidium nasatum]|uniref:Uncharacterized protein n=1 Tax=Armadillidium nasatum TaxID=96803 RepID=A0A5N5SVM9_9CRUS|nr:hypothetical protein Anas_03305 [Armadillidium nasatum]
MDINKFICLTCNEKASSLFRCTNGSFIKLMECSSQFYIKLVLCIILSEGYVRWISFSTTKFGENVSIRNNEYYFYILCISFLLELVIFSAGLFILLPENSERSPSLFCKAVVWGQCSRLLNIASIVYDQGSNLVLYCFISFFIFVSSIQSIRAITFKGSFSTGIDVAAALTVSIIVSRLFQGFFL